MSEMQTNFAQMLATLGEAQQIVVTALNGLGDGLQAERGKLRSLLELVSGFVENAQSVVTLMSEGDADASLIEMAEALGEFFKAAEARVAAMIEASLG